MRRGLADADAAHPGTGVHLDARDWVILRELYRWDAENLPRGALRVPLRELSERTGLHRNTVQARLAQMRTSGVLEGIVFEPRPTFLGLERAGTLFDAPGVTRDRLGALLAGAPNVATAVLAVGAVFLHSWHEAGDDVRAWQGRTARILGAKRHREGYRSTDFPPSPSDAFQPTSLDVRLMRELRRNPGTPLAEVGRRLRVSGRTAELRAKKLIQRGAGAMVPLFRPARAAGAIFVQYVAWQGGERARDALARGFPDRVMGPFGRGQVASVAVSLASVDDVELRRERAQALPGVGPLDAYLIRDVVYPAAFEPWLDRRFVSAHLRVARRDIPAGDIPAR